MKRMSKASTVLLLGACSAFILHFFLTALHCFPEGSLSPRWRSYSHLYSYPQFHQGWGLFAPTPQERDKRIELRYATHGNWSDWVRTEDASFEGHIRWRMTHSSKLYHLNQGVGFHLWRSVDAYLDGDESAEDFYPGSMGYATACHYASAYLHHFEAIESFDSLEVRLILKHPQRGDIEVHEFPLCP